MHLHAVARLPRCFGKEHDTKIDEFIMLYDPKNNEIEVQVAIKDNKVFFKNGWFRMKDFYAIHIGAWALLTYEDSSFMRMSLKNRFHQEVNYSKVGSGLYPMQFPKFLLIICHNIG